MLKDDEKEQGQAECARMRVCALQSAAVAGPSRAILDIARTADCGKRMPIQQEALISCTYPACIFVCKTADIM